MTGHDDEPDARTEILERMRTALAEAPMRTGHTAPVAGALATAMPQLSDEALVDRFADRVDEYRATVIRTPESTAPAAIADVLAAWGGRRIVVPAGFPVAWLAPADITQVFDDPPLTRDVLDGVDGVVTTCALGIAESGTIVLDAGAGQGRRALSLLPDRHLCVIRAEQIVQDVPDATDRLDARRPLTWISGPSATSDIELERVEGVHGPRTLTVVLIEPG